MKSWFFRVVSVLMLLGSATIFLWVNSLPDYSLSEGFIYLLGWLAGIATTLIIFEIMFLITKKNARRQHHKLLNEELW